MSKPLPDRIFMREGWFVSAERQTPDDVEYVRVGGLTSEDVELCLKQARRVEMIGNQNTAACRGVCHVWRDLASRIRAQLPE